MCIRDRHHIVQHFRLHTILARIQHQREELCDRASTPPDTNRVHTKVSKSDLAWTVTDLLIAPYVPSSSRSTGYQPYLKMSVPLVERLSAVVKRAGQSLGCIIRRAALPRLHQLRSGKDKRRPRTRTQNQWRRQVGLPHRAEICPCP